MRLLHWLRVAVIVALIGAALPITAIQAQDGGDLPAWDDLAAGEWNAIRPGGDTRCLYGDDYAFFVRPAAVESDQLMIFFQGGGACWDGASCADKGAFASEYDVSLDEMARFTDGILDFDNPANPVSDYHAVFVAYCSGDVFSGDAEATFTEPEPLTVYFNGWHNTQAVLDWTFANAPQPSQVFLGGASAGGYGATVYAPAIMEQYAGVPVVHVADGAVGVMPAETDALTLWNAAVSVAPLLGDDLAPDTLMTDTMIALTATYPDNTFAYMTTFVDITQVAFYAYLSGIDLQAGGEELFRQVAQEWAFKLLGQMLQINAAAENFRSYLAGGTLHTFLLRPEFYTYVVGDVTARDWFAALLAGEAESVGCDVMSGECLEAPEAVAE